MSAFELRAEHRPAEVGRQVRCWHITRTRHLSGLCRRLLDPCADALPITEAAAIAPRLRCEGCWRLHGHATALAHAPDTVTPRPLPRPLPRPGPGPGCPGGPRTGSGAYSGGSSTTTGCAAKGGRRWCSRSRATRTQSSWSPSTAR